MKTLDFKKEKNKCWYIVLPGWKGDKFELKMVGEASTLLDILSNKTDNVKVNVSLTKEKGFCKLTKFVNTPIAGGALYFHGYKTIMLGAVTEFVFDGQLPKRIYCKVV